MSSAEPVSADGNDWIAELGELLERRLDEITAAMIDVYKEKIPSYASAPPEVMAEVKDAIESNIRGGAAILRGQVTPDLIDVPLANIARRRAQQGIPLHDLLLAGILDARALWRTIRDEGSHDPTGSAEVYGYVIEVILEMLQHAMTVLPAAYLEVEQARVADLEHDLQSVTESLAGLRPADPGLRSRALRHGIEFDRIGWCVVIGREEAALGEEVRKLRRMFPTGAVGRIEGAVVAFIPGEQQPELTDVVPCGLALAVGTAAGYRHAQAALRVALHLGREMVRYEDVVPLALVLDGTGRDRDAFLQAQIGPLLRDKQGPELLRSLDAFYRAGQSVAKAARDLYVHRHTLEYRLERIGSVLGRDIREPDDRMLIELALALRPRIEPPSPTN